MNKRKALYILFVIQIVLIGFLSVPVALKTYTPFFYITSGSMSPEIPEGSVVFLSRHEKEFVEPSGKICVYYDPVKERTIMHRIFKEQDGYYITKGDTNFFLDRFYPTEKYILGFVVFKLTFVKNILGPVILLLGLLALLFIMLQLKRKQNA